jgi:uncharacterized protein YkwD
MQELMQRLPLSHPLTILAGGLALLATLFALAPANAGAVQVRQLIAPAPACPGQFGTEQPVEAQEQAMLCMTNFARARVGLRPLGASGELDGAAAGKAGDIIDCDEFSHQACGREFTYWMERVGYLDAGCWRAAENIAWGTGQLGSVRAIFSGWMRSAGHRHNILGRYQRIGIGLEVGSVDDYSGAAVWVQQFGAHC